MSHKEPLSGRKFIQMMRPILGLPENVVHITISASAGGMVDIDLSMMPSDSKTEVDRPEVDWSQAPEWANYWAMCDDGAVWFTSKPKPCQYCGASAPEGRSFWYQPEPNQKQRPAPNFDWPKERWNESLVKRPG